MYLDMKLFRILTLVIYVIIGIIGVLIGEFSPKIRWFSCSSIF